MNTPDNKNSGTPERQRILDLFNSGSMQEAKALCEQYCANNDNDAEIWFIRGSINNIFALHDESETCYRKVIAINPDIPPAHFNLGYVLLRKINVTQSYNLGGATAQQEIRKQAIESFRTAIKLNSSLFEAHHQLGIALIQDGNIVDGIQAMKEALRLNPESEEIRINLSKAYAEIVPRWHFPMLNDAPRNKAFEEAVEKAIDNDTIVFEIGTGAGLVSMIAARAGAKHVYTCEAIPAIADKARKIIAKNGYADKITVLGKPSTDVRIGIDMPRKADVFVSELVDSGLLGDDAIEFVEHARNNFLMPDGKVIPKGATVYAALVESNKLYEENYVQEACGFDLRLMNEFSTAFYVPHALEHYPHRYLSEVFEVFSFDFSGAKINPEQKSLQIQIINDGSCQTIAFWFKLFLDDEVCFDSGPPYTGHWMQNVQFIEQPLQVHKGQVASLTARHDRRQIRFSDPVISC